MASHTCIRCGKEFTRKDSLRRHEKYCAAETSNIREVKDNTFPTSVGGEREKSEPQREMTVHTCSRCGKGFTRRDNLRRHEKFCEVGVSSISDSFVGERQDAGPSRKRQCLEPTKQQLLLNPSEEYESACEGRLKSYFLRSSEFESLDTFLLSVKTRAIELIRHQLAINNAIKINMVAECSFENNLGESSDRSFKTTNKAIFFETELDSFLKLAFRKLTTEMEEAEMKKSGWFLVRVDGLRLRINKYQPLKGSTYIPLPKFIADRKCCINVQNSDSECFRYSMLAKFIEQNPERTSLYKNLTRKYNFSEISFPTPLHQIKKFEKRNNVSVNVFALDEDNTIYPLKVTPQEKPDHTDLLLLENEGKQHYVWIKNFNKFITSELSKHGHSLTVCKRCFSKFYSRYGKSMEEKLLEHSLYCKEQKPAIIEIPQNTIIKYENVERQLRAPFVIYADFEASLIPIQGNQPSPNASFTIKYQKHEPFAFCTYLKPSDEICHLLPSDILKPYVYRGENAAKHFVNHLIGLADTIFNIIKRVEPIRMTDLEKRQWFYATKCYLCNKNFTDTNCKVRDHCHITGKYRGSACNFCNLRAKTPRYVPVIIHNLSNYDSHFIVRELGETPGRIDVIPHTEEKYITISKHVGCMKLRFIDSFKFMASSLDDLVKNLPNNAFRETSKFYNASLLPLVLRKGVFPYDYVTSIEKLDETHLPPKEFFFNRLRDAHISDEEYSFANEVWNAFGCNSLGDYSDQYLKTDVLLLADVFENFRDVTMKTHKIDPCHYFTAPGMAWDAMLRFTGVQLQLLTDYDMILMVERGIRGGLCQVSHRFAEANNKFMENFNPAQESTFITYFDANNLYGDAQSRYLPYGGFEWVSQTDDIDILSIPEDSPYGYILEVDVDYPAHLHPLHNDLPFLPESTIPPNSNSKVKKLIPHLGGRRYYVVHYVALQQAIRQGLQLSKIHRAIKFRQSPWLRPYIELNTQLGQQASNYFEKGQ